MRPLNLNTGTTMPPIGFGTSRLHFRQGRRGILEALHTGYRLIDTARLYMNHRTVGNAVRDSGIPREDIFVTTKLWNLEQGYRSAHRAFASSLKRLRLDYVDLYLIHWPVTGKRQDSWQALTEIHESGQAKAIGVSNYTVRHLTELMDQSDVIPAVNQIEFNPYLYEQQAELLAFCKKYGIVVQAYRPLAWGRNFDNEILQRIAEHHGKTVAQVMLRWAIEHGTVPLPKSSNSQRIRENFDVFDFNLSKAEIEQVNRLSNGRRTLRDPEEIA